MGSDEAEAERGYWPGDVGGGASVGHAEGGGLGAIRWLFPRDGLLATIWTGPAAARAAEEAAALCWKKNDPTKK